jgi:hypothetical protein
MFEPTCLLLTEPDRCRFEGGQSYCKRDLNAYTSPLFSYCNIFPQYLYRFRRNWKKLASSARHSVETSCLKDMSMI